MKRLILILIAVFIFMYQAVGQCPMCKAGVESNQATMGAKSVGMGLNGGILMLLAAVYLIVFSVGMMWYRNYRKNQITGDV